MNMCFKAFVVILSALISVTVSQDTCETCVLIKECPTFVNMSSVDLKSWMKKYPCDNNHANDNGTGPGSNATEGTLICCPNQIWGMEIESPSSKLTDANQPENPQTLDSFRLQTQNPFPSNTNNNRRINDNNYISIDELLDLLRSKQSTYTETRYWNQRPDRNLWDIGNQIMFRGNNKPSSNTNWRNIYINDQRNNNDNYQGARPRQPDWNARGSGRTDNNSNNNTYYPSNRALGNSFGKPGQCDRLTSSPPSPQSECCGREATDDDRITGTPFKINDKNQLETILTKSIDDAPNISNNFAPAFNNNWPQQQNRTIFTSWSYSSYKDKVNGTETNPNNSTVSTTSGDVNNPVSIENRISGGKATELTQYPWTVLLVTTYNNGLQNTSFNCGGSLISARYVLTAAHCVYDETAVLKSVQIFLAEFDKRTFPRDCKLTGEGRKCIDNILVYSEDVIRHPLFDESRLQNDIALIKLQTDVPYTDYIRPICLPSINIDDPEHARLTLTVAGWGRNGQYKSDIKQSTTVHLVPQNECKRSYPDLTPRHLCAAGYRGEDTCKGDSGGPLMVLFQGKYYVVGVVSGKRTDSPCGSAVPSLYTNVYHYLTWIRYNINK